MSSTLPFDPASPDEFATWLKGRGACAEAVAWVRGRRAVEALAALEPTPQHIAWSCWLADRVLPEAAHRHLLAALLRTLPEHLVVIPAVMGVIEALESESFDPERLKMAGIEARVAREAREATRAADAAMWAAERTANADAARLATAVWTTRTAYKTIWEAKVRGEEVALRDNIVASKQIEVIVSALREALKATG